MMDLQSRKLEFIKEFLKVQSEDVLSRLESILQKDHKLYDETSEQSMSVQEFNERIDASMEDSKNGDLIEGDELKAKIEKWH